MSERNDTSPVFKDKKWAYSYRTSSAGPDGKPVNILHDFYIPVLKRSVAYDRVAGYFRSSSLAAASQGFSAFSAARGKMRLIVGADLSPGDVAAVLKGDEQRLTDHLNRALSDREYWPEDVQNGVVLLAWMVARKHLELRVAFRVHGGTGEALSFDAVDDGYVHEKWGIFTDAQGARIYISGSLNESRRALVHNAENINLHTDWWGDSDRQRIDEAVASFDSLWNNQNPYIAVLNLPDAVSRKLIQIGQAVGYPREIDGSSAFPRDIPPPSAMERLKFAVIKDGPCLPGGRYVGLETAPVKPWPHQEVVARRMVRTWPYNYLLCDEVGLGKTIEAGLAIRSLYLSGLIRRVLISPPASLTGQWHREMAAKCFLPFARVLGGSQVRHEYIFPYLRTDTGNGLYAPDLTIVSTGLLSRQQRQDELFRTEKFDLALVDEAHYARRKNPKNGERSAPKYGLLFHTIADSLSRKTRALWLATATPMQLDWIEVFDLIYLTDRVAHFQHDPSLTWAYYQTLGKLTGGRDMNSHEWELLRRAVSSLERFDPFLWEFFTTAVIDGRIRTVTERFLKQGDTPAGIDRRNIQRLVFAAAPLSRVMMRHTRSLLEIYKAKNQLEENLPKREVWPVPPIVLSGLEKAADQTLETYCRDLTGQIAANNPGSQWRTSLGFYLSFLRLRLASSLFSLRETLKRRKKKVEAALAHEQPVPDADSEMDSREYVFGDSEEVDDTVVEAFLKNRSPADLAWEKDRLAEMLSPLTDLSQMPLKMNEVLSVLDERRLGGGRIAQTVIFTRFYDTLTDIIDRLRKIDTAMRIGTYSGRGGQYVDWEKGHMRNADREDIRQRFFRKEIDVLICTDAAAEGLNLQTADLIINYDLPWNPMKVEQRIGRIDRIGQIHEKVYVLNLCYLGSAEQIVYDRLLNRLAQAGDVVGTQQIALLPVTEEEFEQLAAGELDEDTLWRRTSERIQLQKQRAESMEIPPGELYDIYLQLKAREQAVKVPVSLPDIGDALFGSGYLQALGGTADPEGNLFSLCGLENVPDHTALTVHRRLYETGSPDDRQEIHFASYGDPVFEQVMTTVNKFDLPDCIVRLTERVPDIEATVVAYAAACVDDAGKSEVRLITTYAALADMILDEKRSLEKEDLTALKKRFRQMVRSEFNPTRSIDRIIRDNQQAAKAQRILNLLIADSIFPRVGETQQDNFFQAVTYLDQEIIASRERLLVSRIPVSSLSRIKDDLLISVHVPQTGETTSQKLPIFLIKSAVDEACRLAEGLKERRADITIGRVKRRIRRELAHYL